MREEATTTIAIRPVRMTDVHGLNRFFTDVFADARHVITRPDEYSSGYLSRRLWIARKLTNKNVTCLVALQDNKLVGVLESWNDARARVKHVASFFMAVDKTSQNKGIGRRLLRAYMNWVAAHDTLEKIELHVHSDNQAAYHLYQSLGFTEEGRRLDAIRYEDGRHIDDILMACWPDRMAEGQRRESKSD